MTKAQKIALFLLRITSGWMFFYAGITKLINPSFSAAGYLQGAKLFQGFYLWLASPAMLPFTNFTNAWGLTLLGIALMLGVATRLCAKLGALLMILYYLPLGFPMPNEHAYIVDEHIIYVAALLTLGSFHAGQVWGLGSWVSSWPVWSRSPKLRDWLN